MKRFVFMLSLLLFVGYSLSAQSVQITGNVTSADDGSALPGVTVLVKGTTIGTVTDFNGDYVLQVPASATTLVFSFVGKKTEEVGINGRTVINLVMVASAMDLDEIVVTALGIKREKREVTYQTQKVADDELTTVAPTRVASALAGKVAGLQINIQDNGVNPTTQILLRGLRSISSSNSALIVIDGSISTQGAFDDLNPNDIASISVLKGSNAAALYGSNASNGALIVTTKSGKKGQKLTVGIQSSYTAEKVAYMPKFQSEYGTGWEGAYDAVENTNWGPRFDGTMRQVGPTFPEDYGLATQVIPYAPIKNNILDFFETGNTYVNTLYLTGGDETSSFYASFGDQRADGIIPDDSYRRNTFRVNASKKIGKVEMTANVSYLNDYTSVVGSTIGDQDRPLYWFLLNTSTNIPLSTYWDYTNPLSYGYADNYQNAYYQNPYWAVGTNRNMDGTNRLIGNFNFSWDIADWLNFTARVATNNTWGDGKNWRAFQGYNADLQPSASNVSSFVEDSQFATKIYNGDALLTIDRKFGTAISFKAILGGSVNTISSTNMTIRANNLSIPEFYDISNGTGIPVVSKGDSQEREYGFFGDFTLGYNNYLFLNFSGRNDWTSTLAKGNNSYFYPGVGLSFVFTDAIASLKDNSVLSYGKVTVSNSTVYNAFNPYAINERYYLPSGFPYGDITGFYLDNTTVDANITKEKINASEIGLNLGFLNGRIWFDGSYYISKTTDLITNTTPSYASGATSFLTNIGSLHGSGLELSLGGSVIKAGDFEWDLNLNYSTQTTIIDEIKEGQTEIALNTYASGNVGVFAVVGEAFPQIKGNVYSRDDEGHIIIDPETGWPLTEPDLQNLGRTTPKHILGVNSSLKFKGFSVSATLDYRTGHVYYEQGSQQMEFTGRSLASVSANRQDFVIPNSVVETSPGVYVENTNIQVSGGRQSYWTDVYNIVLENYVKDATAFKIRELAVNYTLPSKLLSSTPISKVTIGFIARNPFTWLPAENMFSDPEFNNTNSNTIGVGGYFQGPPTKSYGFNLNIEF